MAEKKGEKKAKKGEKIEDALLKVALGYQIAEVTEEYAEVDGALKLTKRKKTKKDIPPDLKAVQMLLSTDGGEEYARWSDEELETEKKRLLSILNEGCKKESETENGQGMVEEKTKNVVKRTAVKKKSATKKKTTKTSAVKKSAAVK